MPTVTSPSDLSYPGGDVRVSRSGIAKNPRQNLVPDTRQWYKQLHVKDVCHLEALAPVSVVLIFRGMLPFVKLLLFKTDIVIVVATVTLALDIVI